jgi:hypothetical protein
MQLVIPLPEVQQFINKQINFSIALKNIEENKIEAKYIDSVVLIIKEVKDNVVLFSYEVDGLATLVTKIAHLFMKKKLDNTPIEWDSKNKELRIDLNKYTELNNFLELVYISKIHFISDSIVLEMFARGET